VNRSYCNGLGHVLVKSHPLSQLSIYQLRSRVSLLVAYYTSELEYRETKSTEPAGPDHGLVQLDLRTTQKHATQLSIIYPVLDVVSGGAVTTVGTNNGRSCLALSDETEGLAERRKHISNDSSSGEPTTAIRENCVLILASSHAL